LAARRLAQLDLPADVEPRAGVERAARAGANRAHPRAGPADLHARAGRVVDHQLGPQRAVVGAVPRGLGRRAQRLEARLLLAAGRAAEAGQLEDHPRAVVHLAQRQREVLAAGLDTHFGAAADRRLAGVFPAAAVAAEDDRLLDRRGAEAHVRAEAEVAEVTLAHGRAPVGPDRAGLVVGRDAVVEHDVAVGHAADRAVPVVDRRAAPGVGAAEVGGPAAHVGREADRLRVDELRPLDRVLGAHPEAGVHQVRNRPRVARGVGLEIDERGILHVVAHVV